MALNRKQKEHVRAVMARRASLDWCWESLQDDWKSNGLDPEDPALADYAIEIEDRIQRLMGNPRMTLAYDLTAALPVC